MKSEGERFVFCCHGKGGQLREIVEKGRVLARITSRCQDRPGTLSAAEERAAPLRSA